MELITIYHAIEEWFGISRKEAKMWYWSRTLEQDVLLMETIIYWYLDKLEEV